MLDLVKRKDGLNEKEARWFFQQLIVGLDYCHQMGVASRDIKLENTLLDGGQWPLLKICDFGYSKVRHVFASIASLFSEVPLSAARAIQFKTGIESGHASVPGTRSHRHQTRTDV